MSVTMKNFTWKEIVLLAPFFYITHFDPSKSLLLTIDASLCGRGAVLGHSNGNLCVQLIACKTRKLTKAGRNYAQLDTEALSISFSIHKYHKYLYGRNSRSLQIISLCKKASNHHANLPLEMYSFTLQPPGKHLETTGADDPTLWLLPEG